jgi:hypothetical protein
LAAGAGGATGSTFLAATGADLGLGTSLSVSKTAGANIDPNREGDGSFGASGAGAGAGAGTEAVFVATAFLSATGLEAAGADSFTSFSWGANSDPKKDGAAALGAAATAFFSGAGAGADVIGFAGAATSFFFGANAGSGAKLDMKAFFREKAGDGAAVFGGAFVAWAGAGAGAETLGGAGSDFAGATLESSALGCEPLINPEKEAKMSLMGAGAGEDCAFFASTFPAEDAGAAFSPSDLSKASHSS